MSEAAIAAAVWDVGVRGLDIDKAIQGTGRSGQVTIECDENHEAANDTKVATVLGCVDSEWVVKESVKCIPRVFHGPFEGESM